MVARAGDIGLWRAARRASRKLNETAPSTRKLVASSWGVEAVSAIDMTTLRAAIRDEVKVDLVYEDVNATPTERVIWPLVLIYYVDNAMVVAWCELREDIRHFRLDRIVKSRFLSSTFTGLGDPLIAQWEASQKHDTVTTRDLSAG